MKKLFVILILSSTVFSQTKTQRTMSIESNLIWLKNFDILSSKSEKLNSIIGKIKQDSIINYNPVVTYISKTEHIHDSIDSSKPCKILFVVNQKRYMWLLDLNQFPEYSKILKLLTTEKIEKIEILNDNASRAVFGFRGQCGVIMLKSHDGKLKRLFKKALKKRQKNKTSHNSGFAQ